MIEKSRENTIFNSVITVFMCLFLLTMIYPLWYCFICALSEPVAVYTGNIILFAEGLYAGEFCGGVSY